MTEKNNANGWVTHIRGQHALLVYQSFPCYMAGPVGGEGHTVLNTVISVHDLMAAWSEGWCYVSHPWIEASTILYFFFFLPSSPAPSLLFFSPTNVENVEKLFMFKVCSRSTLEIMYSPWGANTRVTKIHANHLHLNGLIQKWALNNKRAAVFEFFPFTNIFTYQLISSTVLWSRTYPCV